MPTQTEFKRPIGVTTLFVLDLLFGVFWLATTTLCLLIPDAGLRWTLVIVSFLLTVACIAGAFGIFQYHPRGRILNVALAIFSLLFFPFGTVLGALTLHFLFTASVKRLFSGKPIDRLTEEERQALPVPNAGLPLVIAGPLMALVGPFFFGIIGAIAIPNLFNAIDRGKQKRTMADIRTLGTAVEMYSIDHETYPTASDIEELLQALHPDYIEHPIRVDGWERTLMATSRPKTYTLVSLGKDGLQQEGPSGGESADFDDDIIFTDGSFTQWPITFAD